MLLDAAETLAPLDAALSRETYLHAVDAAIVNGDGPGAHGPPRRPSPVPGQEHTRGRSTCFWTGWRCRCPRVRGRCAQSGSRGGTASLAREGDVHASESRPWLWLACRVAVGILEDGSSQAGGLQRRPRPRGRRAGRASRGTRLQAYVLILSGELTRAEELAAESAAITQARGLVLPHQLAWRPGEATRRSD